MARGKERRIAYPGEGKIKRGASIERGEQRRTGEGDKRRQRRAEEIE